MRYLLILTLLLLSSPNAQTSGEPAAPPFDRELHVYDLQDVWQGSAELANLPSYRLELSIADDLRSLMGVQTLSFTNTQDKLLDDALLRLYANALGAELTVSQISVQGEEVTGTFEQNRTSLRVPLPQPLLPGERVELRLEFGLNISDSEVSYGRLAVFEAEAWAALNLAHGYPTLSVLDASGWRGDLPDPSGDPLVAEASLYEVRVTAPADLQLAASGVISERLLQADRQVVTFTTAPVRDFYLAALRGYQLQSRLVDGVLVNSYAPSELAGAAADSLSYAAQSLKRFSAFGTYPYRELDIVALPVSAGGIEYPGIIVLANGIYRDAGTLESVLAHEVAHQWAFNLVGSDQINEPWLDESLTQYLTSVYHDTYGGERFNQGYLAYWQRAWSRSRNEDQAIGLDVAAYSPRDYSAIVYGKGLFFFRELEEELGREILQAGLKTYFETYAWQFAEPEDLQGVLEAACACDLSQTFGAWGASAD